MSNTYQNAILTYKKMKIYCKFNMHSLAKGSVSVSGENTDAHKAC